MELFAGQRGHGIDGVDIVKVIGVRDEIKPAGACLFQHFPVGGGDAADVQCYTPVFRTFVEKIHGSGQIAALAGDAVENTAAAVILNAQAVTVYIQTALAVAFPHEDVAEAVAGTVGRGFGNVLAV